jgi:hypothetical protein
VPVARQEVRTTHLLSPGPAPWPRSDFDPFSLRMELPGAVAALAQSAQANGGTAYVHCTGELAAAAATGPPRFVGARRPGTSFDAACSGYPSVPAAAALEATAVTLALLLQPVWGALPPPPSPTCGGSRGSIWRTRTST